MSPIRVGIIGLTGTPDDNYEGTSWATIAHLPYLKASPHYEIIALLNTSVDSAKAAIKRHGLPAETKAYGDPTDLADDPNIDLVICSVRVDRHLLTVRPSLVAGKAVYVEWPLDRDLETAKEMAALAAKHGAKTLVGVQASFSPVVRSLRSLVQRGDIGRVLSSTLIGSFGNPLLSESRNVRYFLDRSVGGNPVTIHGGHILESVISVLGSFKLVTSASSISRPELDIVDNKAGGKVVESAAPNTVPDQVLLHGTVEPSKAPVTLKLHAGPEFPGLPRLDWRIQGTRGWVRVTSPAISLNVGSPETTIELFKTDIGEVIEIAPVRDEWDLLPVPAQNIARLYEAYRKGEWYPTFDWGVERHEILDAVFKQFDIDSRETQKG